MSDEPQYVDRHELASYTIWNAKPNALILIQSQMAGEAFDLFARKYNRHDLHIIDYRETVADGWKARQVYSEVIWMKGLMPSIQIINIILNAVVEKALEAKERPKRCGDCKHLGEPLTWLDTETWDDVPTKYRTCQRIKMAPDSRRELDVQTDLAFVEDKSDYHAALLTLESFGCNLWEAKGEGE